MTAGTAGKQHANNNNTPTCHSNATIPRSSSYICDTQHTGVRTIHSEHLIQQKTSTTLLFAVQ